MKKGGWGFLIFSFVFLTVGIIFAVVGWNISRQAEELARQPLLDRAALAEGPPGRAGVIEGRVAERNPLQFRTFVGFIRETYQGEDCDDDGCEAIWYENERVWPPLWLDLPGGRVKIINGDYMVTNTTVAWESTERRVAYETVRYRGFEINDHLFAVGQVAPADGGPTFQAESLAGGTRDDQVFSDRVGGGIFLGVGLLFTLIGAGVIGWQFI